MAAEQPRYVLCTIHRLLVCPDRLGPTQEVFGAVCRPCRLKFSCMCIYAAVTAISGTHQRCQIVGGVDPSPRPSSHRSSDEQRAVPFRDSGVQGLLRDGTVGGVEAGVRVRSARGRQKGREGVGSRRRAARTPRGYRTVLSVQSWGHEKSDAATYSHLHTRRTF